MIRKIGKKYAICYDADGSVFEEDFASESEAWDRWDGMRAVDRMLVTGVGPYLNTDSTFLEGTENGRQFQNRPEQGDFYAQVAKKHGQNVKGKKYLSQLARFPGDPEAFVSSRGDVQKVLEARGWGSDGAVNVKARQVDVKPAAPVEVADDIVHRETQSDLDGQTLTIKEYKEKFARTKEKIKPKYKRTKR